MGCIYSDFNGKCNMWSEKDGSTATGCSESGECQVDGDPDMSNSCDSYESDDTCMMCGQDLNVDDCDCDDSET